MINDLIAYWKFDETAGTNALDSVGGNNGTLEHYPGNNLQWVPGIVGNALTFDGSSNCVYVADYPKPETTMTVAAWVWANGGPQWATILRNWGVTDAGQFYFALYSPGGDLSIFVQQATAALCSPARAFPSRSEVGSM